MDNLTIRKIEKYVFKKTSICSQYILQPQLVEMTEVITGQIVKRLEGTLYEMLKDEKIVEHTFSRPTFFEWLFRKNRTVFIKINCKEVLKTTNAINDASLFYTYEVLNG